MYSELILDWAQQGIPGVAAKMLSAAVLPVGVGLQNIQIISFLPAILLAVAYCVLVVLSSSLSSSSLLSQTTFIALQKIAAGKMEDKNHKFLASSLINSPSVSLVLVTLAIWSSIIVYCAKLCSSFQIPVLINN